MPELPHARRGHLRTVVLGVLAAGMLGAGIWRHWGGPPAAAHTSEGAPAVSAATLQPPFTDVTEEAGIDFVHVTGGRGAHWIPEEMGPGAAWLDYDGDDDLDLYLVQGGSLLEPQSGPRNRLLKNEAGRFVDVSASSGADVGGYGFGAAAADYDNDGDVDLYIGRLGRDVLLRNEGGRFTDVSTAAGVDTPGFSTVIVFFDFDADGWLDLFVGRYIDWAPHREVACFDPAGHRDFCNPLTYDAPARDVLYRNRGDGTFADVSEHSGVGAPTGHTLGASSGDFDGDGRLDLYVACDQTPSFLWMNQGGGVFSEEATMRGCAFNADGVAIAGMGVASEDLDGDGDDDLIVTNIHDQPHLGLRNDDGFFEDNSHQWGLGGWGVPYTAFGIAMFDQDHDGRFDAVVANGGVNRHLQPLVPGLPYDEPNQLVRQGADGRFHDASEAVREALAYAGVSRAAVAADYDNDGDLDVVVTNNGGATRLLRNHAPPNRGWIMLDLLPAGGNRHALNARVELHAGGTVQRRAVRPHNGFLGSSDPRLHFGLGATAAVDRVVVHWPGGATEQWVDLPARSVVQLKEGQAPARHVISAGGDGT